MDSGDGVFNGTVRTSSFWRLSSKWKCPTIDLEICLSIGNVRTVHWEDWNCPGNYFSRLSTNWNCPDSSLRRLSIKRKCPDYRRRRRPVKWNCLDNYFWRSSINSNCVARSDSPEQLISGTILSWTCVDSRVTWMSTNIYSPGLQSSDRVLSNGIISLSRQTIATETY